MWGKREGGGKASLKMGADFVPVMQYVTFQYTQCKRPNVIHDHQNPTAHFY